MNKQNIIVIPTGHGGIADLLRIAGETHRLLDAVIENQDKADYVRELAVYLDNVSTHLPGLIIGDRFLDDIYELADNLESIKKCTIEFLTDDDQPRIVFTEQKQETEETT